MVDIKGIINTIMEEEFEIEPELLVPEALLGEDMGLDSLDAVDLVVAIDKKFGVRVEEDVAQTIRTLEDIYNIIEELIKNK